jgi:hypothetical protein
MIVAGNFILWKSAGSGGLCWVVSGLAITLHRIASDDDLWAVGVFSE